MTNVKDEIFFGAQNDPVIGNLLFNVQRTRMGDVCELEVGKGIKSESVMDRHPDSPLNVRLMLCVDTDSDIIHVNALGTSMIVLNSYASYHLLDQRSNTYSESVLSYQV
jgi:hypothetical protein